MSKIVSISITGPHVDWLEKHARKLVDLRLAACANIVPGVKSIYRWRSEVQGQDEALLVLHSQESHVDEIIEITNASHPYETVQILATQTAAVDAKYAAWVVEETTNQTDQ